MLFICLFLVCALGRLASADQQSSSGLHSPLCAVGVARMTFIVGLCVLKDEAVGTLKAIRTLLHTVGTVLEMETFLTVLWSLWGGGVGGRWNQRLCTDQPFKANRSRGKTTLCVKETQTIMIWLHMSHNVQVCRKWQVTSGQTGEGCFFIYFFFFF